MTIPYAIQTRLRDRNRHLFFKSWRLRMAEPQPMRCFGMFWVFLHKPSWGNPTTCWQKSWSTLLIFTSCGPHRVTNILRTKKQISILTYLTYNYSGKTSDSFARIYFNRCQYQSRWQLSALRPPGWQGLGTRGIHEGLWRVCELSEPCAASMSAPKKRFVLQRSPLTGGVETRRDTAFLFTTYLTGAEQRKMWTFIPSNACKCFWKSSIHVYPCDTHIHTSTFTLMHTNKQTGRQALHCLALRCVALHSVALCWVALHCILHHIISDHIIPHDITWHHTTSHCTALNCTTLHDMTLHYITLHYITSHHSTLLYICYIRYIR